MKEVTIETIHARHAVRKYQTKPIEAEKLAEIQKLIDEVNRESGLHIQLVTDEPLAFSTGVFKYGQFSGVSNYLVLAGRDAPPRGSLRLR